jgi:hypothetical protein
VQESKTNNLAFEILSSEKSFAVMAGTIGEKADWVREINDTIRSAREAAGLTPSSETLGQAAPLWVQDSNRSECFLCHQTFGMLKRKHHCRKCGNVVCDKCSPHRLVLANIHKTQKQRVCNSCSRGGQVEQIDEGLLRQMTGSARLSQGDHDVSFGP